MLSRGHSPSDNIAPKGNITDVNQLSVRISTELLYNEYLRLAQLNTQSRLSIPVSNKEGSKAAFGYVLILVDC